MNDATRDERVRNQPKLLPEARPAEQRQRRSRLAVRRQVGTADALPDLLVALASCERRRATDSSLSLPWVSDLVTGDAGAGHKAAL